MRTRICISLILLIALLSGCRSTLVVDQTNPHSIDLHALYTTLDREHPNLYHQTSRREYRKELEDALASVHATNDIDFYFTASKIAALARDSHTSVGLHEELVHTLHALPLQISYVDGAWRLVVVQKSQEPMLGSEVLSINGVRFEEIVDRARALVSYDNEVWFRTRVAQLLNIAELYTYLGIVENIEEVFTISIDHYECKNISTYTYKALSIEQFYQNEYATLYDRMPETGAFPTYYRSLFLQEGSVLFIQYNVCASDPAYPLNTFTQDMIALISENSVERIIIDLRYNSGGNSRLLEVFIDQLRELQKKQRFAIDVLIGERTFSSAIMNAIQLQARTNARLVGNDTGGSVNHYGELGSFMLSYSKLPVQYSTKYFVMDRKHPGGSLKPDLSISPTVADLLSGIDAVVEAIL